MYGNVGGGNNPCCEGFAPDIFLCFFIFFVLESWGNDANDIVSYNLLANGGGID